MNLPPPPWVPSARILADLNKHSAELMGHTVLVTARSIIHGLTLSTSGHVDEVGTLAWFFANGLRQLEAGWNASLEHTTVSIKGVFCHKSGSGGPVVDFTHPYRCGGGCELSDLLFMVTGKPGTGSGASGNAVFLQAKAKRWPLSGDSTNKQAFLYEDATDFTFRKPVEVSSSTLPENTTAGLRHMPIDRARGFKFWFFDPKHTYPFKPPFRFSHRYWRLASTIADPGRINYPILDSIFPAMLFDLVTGRDGLGFSTAVANDFGWNRIVRDVVKASIGKAMSVPKKIDGRNPPRIDGWSAAELAQFAANDTAVISNPFTDLGAAFGDEELIRSMAKLARAERTKPDTERSEGRDDGPPNRIRQEPEDDDGGGGSFIWINLREKQE